MRRFAFGIAVFGIFILVLLMSLNIKEVEHYGEVEELEVNTKVFVSGSVVEEKVFWGNRKVLELENGIELVCECSNSFVGERVRVVGLVGEYAGKKRIEVLEIISG